MLLGTLAFRVWSCTHTDTERVCEEGVSASRDPVGVHISVRVRETRRTCVTAANGGAAVRHALAAATSVSSEAPSHRSSAASSGNSAASMAAASSRSACDTSGGSTKLDAATPLAGLLDLRPSVCSHRSHQPHPRFAVFVSAAVVSRTCVIRYVRIPRDGMWSAQRPGSPHAVAPVSIVAAKERTATVCQGCFRSLYLAKHERTTHRRGPAIVHAMGHSPCHRPPTTFPHASLPGRYSRLFATQTQRTPRTTTGNLSAERNR